MGFALVGAYALRPNEPNSSFITAPVTVGDIEDAVLAAGTIQAFKQVSVGAQASGQIKALHVALGDKVRKGQLVAEIDSLTQQNTLRTAEAELDSVKAQLLSKTATLKQVELAFERQKVLLGSDVSTRKDYEASEASLAVAKAEVDALNAQIAQARISVDTARVNLGYTRIVAPMDGTVVAVIAQEGQTVNANQSTPTIIKLARMDTVTVKVQISEADVTRVKPGQSVYFTILGEPEQRFTTKLRAIEPAPDSISSDSTSSSSSSSTSSTSSSSSSAIYYNGMLDVPNTEGKLRISMTAQVHIVRAEALDALTIPSAALGEKDAAGLYDVRVLDRDGKVAMRKVRIGLDNKVSAQVLSGLSEGQRVILGEASATPAVQEMRRPGPPPM